MKNKLPIYKKIFFTFVVTVGFLTLLELTARVMSFFVEPAKDDNSMKRYGMEIGSLISDEVLNHKWKPNYLDKTGETIHFVTNKQGWIEDYDISLKKPENTFRIFYVGDSNVQGRVPYKKNMVEQVECALNKSFGRSGMRYEVINTGVSSYSPILYHLLIKYEILPYAPDLVIINVDMTDVPNDKLYFERAVFNSNGELVAAPPFGVLDKHKYLMTPRGVKKSNYWEIAANFLLEHVVFLNTLSSLLASDKNTIYDKEAVRSVTKGKWEWIANNNHYDRSADWLSRQWTEDITKNVRRSMDILSKTINLLKKKNIRVALTGVPHLPQFLGAWSPRPHSALRAVAQACDIPYLDSFMEIKTYCKGDVALLNSLYFDDDPTHFDEKGNEIWAETQTRFLIENQKRLLLLTKPPEKRIVFGDDQMLDLLVIHRREIVLAGTHPSAASARTRIQSERCSSMRTSSPHLKRKIIRPFFSDGNENTGT